MTPDQIRTGPLGEVASFVAREVLQWKFKELILTSDREVMPCRPLDLTGRTHWLPELLALRALGVLERRGWRLELAMGGRTGRTLATIQRDEPTSWLETATVDGPASTHFADALLRAIALAVCAEQEPAHV